MYLYIGGLLAKKLELLREVAPAVDNIGLVVNPGTPSAKLDTAEWAAVASSSGKPSARILNARTEAEIDAVFADLGKSGTAAAVVGSDSFTSPIASILPPSRRLAACPRSITLASSRPPAA